MIGKPPHRSGTWATPQILIITADAGAGGLLATYLQESAFRVTVAADGAAMEEFIHTGAVDLLILDMVLPNYDGLDLCKRLRTGGSDIPLIMFSSRNRERDRVLGLDAGADDYLIQPFSGRELVARIRALFRRCRSTPRVSAASEYCPPGVEVVRLGSA